MPLWRKRQRAHHAPISHRDAAVAADVSVIGQGFVLKGDIAGQGRVRLMGRLEGRIDIQGEVAVGLSAVVKGDIQADAVAVEGRIEGGLRASQGVALGAAAQGAGTVVANRLAMAEGAQLNGDIRTGVPQPMK